LELRFSLPCAWRGARSKLGRMRLHFLILLAVSLNCGAAEPRGGGQPTVYQGMADASAAVTVGTNFFIVADDEDNHLRLYHRHRPGAPIKSFDLTEFLEVKGRFLEADIEGGARIGNRAFWIGSHGRNRVGKERFNRCRLFATDIAGEGESVTLTPVGRPYTNLLEDLTKDPRLSQFRLSRAARRAPKEAGALNIEGLAATPGGGLLIGFRNPIPNAQALLVPLLNPNEVVFGATPRLGAPIQIDLGGLGVRDLIHFEGSYLILAGPFHERGPFRLYRWEEGSLRPEIIPSSDFGDAHPEAVLVYPDTGLREIQILSDDGTQLVNGSPAKQTSDRQKRSFRSFWVVP